MKLFLSCIIFMSCLGCAKNNNNPHPTPTQPQINSSNTNQSNNTIPAPSDYWGCWHEINNTVGVYDIILTENTSIAHGFQFATNCTPLPTIPVMNIGVFRNDTLILDNGTYEYWCYVESDTLTYSAYETNATIIRLIQ